MGVPLQPPPNHLTASSSAIANYSRITLHSFNSAASQALLSENCGAPRADGSLRFSGTAAVESDVSLYCEKDNAGIGSFVLSDPGKKPLDWTSRRLCRICIEDFRR